MNQNLKKIAIAALGFLCFSGLNAQNPIKKQAFTGVTIHYANGKTSQKASITWNTKFFEAIGKANTNGALTWDGGDSLHVYPAFIDGMGTHGSPDNPRRAESVDDPGNPPLSRAGIQPHRKPHLNWDEKKAKELESILKSGFGAANLGLNGFMMSGSIDLVVLTDGTPLVIMPETGQAAAFANAPGGWRNGVYPSTLMGLMARFRQLWFDAEALKKHIELYEAGKIAEPPIRSQEHEALFDYLDGSKKLYFVADTPEDIERVFKLQDELGFKFVLVSGKHAHEKSSELKARNVDVLATFNFDLSEEKKKSDWGKKKGKDKEVEKEETEEEVETDPEVEAFKAKAEEARKEQLHNIKNLMKAGVRVGYASIGEDKGAFKKGMQALMEEGYTETELLMLLTQHTAEIIGAGDKIGKLESGYMANFMVTDKPLSDKKAKILYTVSGGVVKDHTKE